MYTCLIVDDQPEAVDLIRDHVIKIPQLTIQLMTTDAIAALAFLDTTKPDIIFLDIEMPGITGIEFIENVKSKWGNNMPKIVFTTGYSDYALTGYEHGVVDYLLKPVSFSRFKKCIDRIIGELDKRTNIMERPNFFFAEDDGKKTRINFDDIVYVEGAGNYIVIVTNEVKTIIYKSMNSLQELLPADKFMRIHKSYILAIDKIQAIKGNEIIIPLKEGTKNIPIGITFKEDVMRRLGIG
jgi:DNA-binding LytR/AlgR family response regulator